MILFPSTRFSCGASDTARWTSSIAPVYLLVRVRENLKEGELTMITGQRSLAEMYAKDVLSAVEYNGVFVSHSMFCSMLRRESKGEHNDWNGIRLL